MAIGILIPFRGTRKDKSRLRESMDDHLVDELLRAMFIHVLNEVVQIKLDKTIYILTTKKHLDFCRYKHEIINDTGDNLNKSLTEAIIHVKEEIVVIIMADLPLVTKKEILVTIQNLQRYDVVIAPSDDKGTSVLAFKRNINCPFLFGKNSSLNFLRYFKKTRHKVKMLKYSQKFRDIDTFKDILHLQNIITLSDKFTNINQGRGD